MELKKNYYSITKLSKEILSEKNIKKDDVYYKYSQKMCTYSYNILKYSVEKEDTIAACMCELFVIKTLNKLNFENGGFVQYMITTARNSITQTFLNWMKWKDGIEAAKTNLRQ